MPPFYVSPLSSIYNGILLWGAIASSHSDKKGRIDSQASSAGDYQQNQRCQTSWEKVRRLHFETKT